MYGFVPIDQICASLNVTRHQVHSKASRLRLTKRSKCGTCGIVIIGTGPRKPFYCSRECKLKSLAARHRFYVASHLTRVKELTKAWKERNWGESSPEIALRAEKFAMETILPKLGFTELYHASAIKRFVPFDLIATYKGQRVLIDVTTGVSKTLVKSYQQSFADALRMPLYYLFVKPDFSKYQLTLCQGSKTVHMHIAELIPIE